MFRSTSRSSALLVGASSFLASLLGTARADTLARCGLDFDGVDDCVVVPAAPELENGNAFTAEAWVCANDASKGAVVGIWGEGGVSDRFLLDFDSGLIHGRIALSGIGQVIVTHSVPVGNWFHVALSYDGARLALHLDGQLVAFVDKAGSLPVSGQPLKMGIEEIGFQKPHYFDGMLDEVRLFGHARTDDEIARAFNQKLALDTPGLLANWSFDESAGDQTVRDTTAFGHHGTLGADANVGADDPLRLASDAPIRWEDLGQALGGATGTPHFEAFGELTPGSQASFRFGEARALAHALLIVGDTAISQPFKSGILVPAPQFLFSTQTDALGRIDFDVLWAGGAPPCTNLYLQWWVFDPSGPQGLTASNALRLETP